MRVSSLPLVRNKEGVLGRLEAEPAGAGASHGLMVIRLEDGRQMHIPQNILSAQEDGSFLLPLSLLQLEQTYSGGATVQDGGITVPVMAEELQVGTRTVETGRVLIHKTVQEHEETVDPQLLRHSVVVERVAINRYVDGPVPGVRHEGDVMIVPVLEEVLVVEKRLMLKEEVHIRQEQSVFHAPQQVTVRREEVQVERTAVPDVSNGLETTSGL